jgi:hypothetical protein
MAQTITQTQTLLALSRMMGKRSIPTNADNADWIDYCQTAFDYAWRYYKWDWSLRTVTVDLVNDPYLPEDFDIGGYRQATPTTDGEIKEVSLYDYARLPSGLRNFALQWDNTEGKYEVLSASGLDTISFTYQITPPTLDDDTPVPFPSAMTIGIGASIYAKQGENSTKADITQEWDEFHAELDRHVGRVDKAVPRLLNQNLQDEYNTYTGDARY